MPGTVTRAPGEQQPRWRRRERAREDGGAELRAERRARAAQPADGAAQPARREVDAGEGAESNAAAPERTNDSATPREGAEHHDGDGASERPAGPGAAGEAGDGARGQDAVQRPPGSFTGLDSEVRDDTCPVRGSRARGPDTSGAPCCAVRASRTLLP